MSHRRSVTWAGSHLSGEGGYIRGLILQAALGMTILALAVNDGGQIIAAQVRAESVARAAATTGADTWFRTHKPDRVKADAEAAAAAIDANATVTSVDITTDGTVTVRVEKLASTLGVGRIGFLEKYATQVATDSEKGLKPS
jgi:hypothetical protein